MELNRKSLLILVVVVLLLGWFVVSSVNSFHQLFPGNNNTSNTGGSTGSSHSSGSTGTGSGGSGSGFSGFGGLPFSWNFTGGFHFPNLTLPPLNLSNVHLPFNITFPGLFGSGSNGNNGTGAGGTSGSGSGGGGSGSSGSSGTGGTSTNNGGNSAPIIPFKINPVILIALLAVVAALIAFATVRHVHSTRSAKQDKEEETPEDALALAESTDGSNPQSYDSTALTGKEVISSFSGWGGTTKLIHPDIKPELPLIWGSEDPLKISVEEKAQIIVPASLERGESGDYTVTFADRCNLISAKERRSSETIWLRAVNYSEDVRRFFLLNFVNAGQENRYLTARELISGLKRNASGAEVRDVGSLDAVLKAFEKSFYGKKAVSRSEFEDYMLRLSSGLPDAKIIVCSET